MHLPGGFTRIAILPEGKGFITAPTNSIPQQLRSLGSRVLVVSTQTDEIIKLGEDEFHKWGEKSIVEFDPQKLGKFEV